VVPSSEKAVAKGMRTSVLWCSLRYALQNSSWIQEMVHFGQALIIDGTADKKTMIKAQSDNFN